LQALIETISRHETLKRAWHCHSFQALQALWQGHSLEALVEAIAKPVQKVVWLLGRVTPCKFWLKEAPKVNFSRLFGRVTPSRLLSK